jgi:hypothetical protein
VQALELLVRLLCFGSAVSLASQAVDRHALARQRCFLSRRRRLEQSYPRGKWVVFASLVVSLRTICWISASRSAAVATQVPIHGSTNREALGPAR